MNEIKLARQTAPITEHEILKFIEHIFGEEEAKLEAPQLNGKETEHNFDVVCSARENGRIVGMVHATVPKLFHQIAGISAMCVSPEVRGKGVGAYLLKNMIDYLAEMGVKSIFLGTHNPVAAKMYKKAGFSYLPGSYVMVRFTEGDMVDFVKDTYKQKEEEINVIPGNAAMRIPMIPFVLGEFRYTVLDMNTELYHCNFFSQRSCMGLYPRYESLAKKGGNFWGAVNKHGVLVGLLSAVPVGEEVYTDFFVADGFEKVLPEMIHACTLEYGDVRFQVLETDRTKRALLEQHGFFHTADTTHQKSGICMKVGIYQKRNAVRM